MALQPIPPLPPEGVSFKPTAAFFAWIMSLKPILTQRRIFIDMAAGKGYLARCFQTHPDRLPDDWAEAYDRRPVPNGVYALKTEDANQWHAKPGEIPIIARPDFLCGRFVLNSVNGAGFCIVIATEEEAYRFEVFMNDNRPKYEAMRFTDLDGQVGEDGENVYLFGDTDRPEYQTILWQTVYARGVKPTYQEIVHRSPTETVLVIDNGSARHIPGEIKDPQEILKARVGRYLWLAVLPVGALIPNHALPAADTGIAFEAGDKMEVTLTDKGGLQDSGYSFLPVEEWDEDGGLDTPEGYYPSVRVRLVFRCFTARNYWEVVKE